MSDAPRATADQIKQVAAMIRAGHSRDEIIAAHVGLTEEQVAGFRAQGLGCPIKKSPPRKKR